MPTTATQANCGGSSSNRGGWRPHTVCSPSRKGTSSTATAANCSTHTVQLQQRQQQQLCEGCCCGSLAQIVRLPIKQGANKFLGSDGTNPE
jgi:hypothetical protein